MQYLPGSGFLETHGMSTAWEFRRENSGTGSLICSTFYFAVAVSGNNVCVCITQILGSLEVSPTFCVRGRVEV